MKVLKERLTSWKRKNETRLVSVLAYDFFSQWKWSFSVSSKPWRPWFFGVFALFFARCSSGYTWIRFSRTFHRSHGFKPHRVPPVILIFSALPASFSALVPSRSSIFSRAFLQLYALAFPCLSGYMFLLFLPFFVWMRFFFISRAWRWLRKICFESCLVNRNVLYYRLFLYWFIGCDATFPLPFPCVDLLVASCAVIFLGSECRGVKRSTRSCSLRLH